ncbi:piggyBac transposable element-derived protein 4-like [Homalodisca vitripennis]|uniref:piggyBac transposable element-derived protein 4-like n=1 Tax=Homalodisca vitripennis TaxID=197043 RepID=UPI001EEB8C78|nr:piggyBac transposable element-derived protein 4-like [Homalodisca vitripennis]
MEKEKLTPRKITKLLDSDSDDDEGPTDLSAESEVFDSDKDPDLRPINEDRRIYQSSRLFELKYQRQLEPDQIAGSSTGAVEYESDEYSEPTTKKQIENQEDVKPSSRLHKWTPTTPEEMRKFVALVGYMGLVKYLSLQDYWSKSPLYDNTLVRNAMSRNRFEILLRMWHFADYYEKGNNRLHKIENLMNMCIERFKEAYTPGNKICVDESMIAWKGRLVFRQYNPRKRHRYGIKLYKLCASKENTWTFSVYIGQDRSENDWSTSENVICKLLGGLLDNGTTPAPGGLMGEGRTLITDNWYTSVPLVVGLLEHKAHLIGTVRIDRKYLPPEVSTKLKKTHGDSVIRETAEGIVFLKWKDKRDVPLLSTVHTNEYVEVTSKRGKVTQKPKDVMLYNEEKFSIDMSDQMATYGTALRRGTKWYRKLAVEIVWGMVVVNAHFLYVENSGTKMPIKKFRESIILSLLKYEVETPRRSVGRPTHRLIDCLRGDPPKKTRGRCRSCYEAKGRSGVQGPDGKISKAKQVFTICDTCEGRPFMCRTCFNNHV